MKKKLLVAILVAFLAVPALVNAEIQSWNCAADGDHAIDIVGTPTWTDNGDDYTLSMICTQNGLLGSPELPGHISGDFIADSDLDPTVLIAQTVDNHTDFSWSDYHITIGMDKTFSILTTGVITPANWIYNVSAVTPGIIPNGGGSGYVGTIDYYIGTGNQIGIGQSGDFGFKVSFLGSVNFTTELIPTVPEPATITLLCIGALALLRKK
jgi:hypothetical protein